MYNQNNDFNFTDYEKMLKGTPTALVRLVFNVIIMNVIVIAFNREKS